MGTAIDGGWRRSSSTLLFESSTLRTQKCDKGLLLHVSVTLFCFDLDSTVALRTLINASLGSSCFGAFCDRIIQPLLIQQQKTPRALYEVQRTQTIVQKSAFCWLTWAHEQVAVTLMAWSHNRLKHLMDAEMKFQTLVQEEPNHSVLSIIITRLYKQHQFFQHPSTFSSLSVFLPLGSTAMGGGGLVT